MAEVAPSGNGGGVNRTFLLIVGGLAGLLILGLVAAGVLLFLPGMLGGNKTPVAAVSTTPTRVAIQATATTAKATPTNVKTATLVVASTPGTGGFVTATPVTSGGISGGGSSTTGGGAGAGGNGSKGGVPEASGTPTTGGELPSSGLGDNLLLLVAGLGLVAVIFVARYARAAG